MDALVRAQFVVDHPIHRGTIRAILDTLSAQGGPYFPQFVSDQSAGGLLRVSECRPSGLFERAAAAGSTTVFLRESEGNPVPVLSLTISAVPRSRPSLVTLIVPTGMLSSSPEIEQVLGICKGLYLFLEAPWGTVGMSTEGVQRREPKRGVRSAFYLDWANFFGPHVVTGVGPIRLLTSTAFIVEILPDGGMMLVTHPSPALAAEPGGEAVRRQMEEALGVAECLESCLPGFSAMPRGARRDGCRGYRCASPG